MVGTEELSGWVRNGGLVLRRSFPWVVAAVLLVGAGTFLVLQVEIDGDGSGVSCGSSFDVLTGRVGWEEWWAQDLVDPSDTTRGRLVRAEDCAGAINDNILVAGVLTAGAVGAAVLGSGTWRGRRQPVPAGRTSPALDLQRLGRALLLVGAALTMGGAVAITLLVADPDSTLFLYVDRIVVALIGVIVLIPAIALMFGGRAIGLVGRHLDTSDHHDADA